MTQDQINAIVAKMAFDLSPGGIAALKEVLNAMNAETVAISTQTDINTLRINNIRTSPVVLASNSLTFSQGYVVQAGGAVTITLDAPNPGDIEISA